MMAGMIKGVSIALKRALWCRWFHRWRMPRRAAAPVVSRDPSGQALRLTAGPRRSLCGACEGRDDYGGRAYRRWCAS